MRSIHILAIAIICTVVIVLCGTTWSDEATATKPSVGYVDLQKVSYMAKPVQETISSVEEALKPKQQEAEKKMQQLDVLKMSYEQQKSILSEKHRKERQREIREIEDEVETLSEQINEMLTDMETNQLSPAYDMIMEQVRRIAQRKGLDLVLPVESVIWADPSLDITDDVIEALNSNSSSPEKSESTESNATIKQLPEHTKEEHNTRTHDTSTTGGIPSNEISW